jgi:hypothetical protein
LIPYPSFKRANEKSPGIPARANNTNMKCKMTLGCLLLLLATCVNAAVSVLVEDTFDGTGTPNATKYTWGGEVALNGAGQLNFSTQVANTAWLQSRTSATPAPGQTLVLQMRAFADAIIYGDAQPRGLRVGSDPNNAIEFYSASRLAVGIRLRSNGVETLASYTVTSGIDSMHDYGIFVTPGAITCTVDGNTAGTFTGSLPAGALNLYVDTCYGGPASVSVSIDSLSLSVTNEDFSYTSTNGAITITGYRGTDNIVSVPSTINGLPVVSIGDAAFYGMSALWSISIPDSVTNIGASAFFACTSLTNAPISAYMTSIGDSAFSRCASLTAFIVNSTNSVYHSLSGVLFTGDGRTLVTYPCGRGGSYNVPSGDYIGTNAFAWCATLTSIVMPINALGIGDSAFEGCVSLNSVTLDSRLATIGNRAFCGCGALAGLTLPSGLRTIGDYGFFASGLTSISLPDHTLIGTGVFSQCAKLSKVTVGQLNTHYQNIAGALYDTGNTRLM